MHGGREKLFLLATGITVGIFFFFARSLFAKRESRFRDDLWIQKRKAEAERQAKVQEDKMDERILLEHRPDPREPDPEPAPASSAPPFRLPNFRGAPHEVLGVAVEADSATVNRAFKYWIKRYHPDRVAHLGGKYVEQARRRAEQLNTARQELLRRRG